MEWQETTERNGKIVDDMYVTDSRGKYLFVCAHDGEIIERKELTYSEKEKMINDYDLIPGSEIIFRGCITYRTAFSYDLIDYLLRRATGM